MKEKVYKNPDGSLVLSVKYIDEECLISFEDYPWHTHINLVGDYNTDAEKKAPLDYLNEIFTGNLDVCILRINGIIVDIWITDNPVKDKKYLQDNEKLTVRKWLS